MFKRQSLFFIFALVTAIFIFEFNIYTKRLTNNKYNLIYDQSSTLPTVFCIIPASLNSIKTQALKVQNAWAKHCDKHFFVTIINPNITNTSTETTIDGVPVLQPKDFISDQYLKLTDKIFRTAIHVNDKYKTYDWYVKGDLDTFFHIKNMKRFLSRQNKSEPVSFGYDFKVTVEGGYHSGAGYVLSNEIFMRIGKTLTDNYTNCFNSGYEDQDMGFCSRKLGGYCGNSTDEYGRERFHVYSIGSHFKSPPEWLYGWSKNQVKTGRDCCSDEWISFHKMSMDEITQLGIMVDKYESSNVSKKLNSSAILYHFL